MEVGYGLSNTMHPLKTLDTIGIVKDQSSHLVYLSICVK